MDNPDFYIVHAIGINKLSLEPLQYKFNTGQGVHTDKKSGKQTIYAICDSCGAEYQDDFGFEFKYGYRGNWGGGRGGYCKKCASKIVPIIEKAFEDALEEIRSEERC